MDFHTWLKDWLARHPLREPRGLDRARYTAQVMRNITEGAPQPRPAFSWIVWPRIAMALAATAAGAAIIFSAASRINRKFAQSPPPRPLMLAESMPSDETWIKETAQLLDQLDEESSKADAHATSDEEWLKELQTLDEHDLGSNS